MTSQTVIDYCSKEDPSWLPLFLNDICNISIQIDTGFPFLGSWSETPSILLNSFTHVYYPIDEEIDYDLELT